MAEKPPPASAVVETKHLPGLLSGTRGACPAASAGALAQYRPVSLPLVLRPNSEEIFEEFFYDGSRVMDECYGLQDCTSAGQVLCGAGRDQKCECFGRWMYF